MDIKKSLENETLTAKISGRIDTTTAPALGESLAEGYDSCEKLILDFAEVDYISSAGLRILLSAQKVMSKKGGMKLVNVNSDIMDIFEVTGFQDILTIE